MRSASKHALPFQCFVSAEGKVRIRALCNASWLRGHVHGRDDLEDNNTRTPRSSIFSAQICGLVMCYAAVTTRDRIAEQREPLTGESHNISADSIVP